MVWAVRCRFSPDSKLPVEQQQRRSLALRSRWGFSWLVRGLGHTEDKSVVIAPDRAPWQTIVGEVYVSPTVPNRNVTPFAGS